jgi:hypothetical protein
MALRFRFACFKQLKLPSTSEAPSDLWENFPRGFLAICGDARAMLRRMMALLGALEFHVPPKPRVKSCWQRAHLLHHLLKTPVFLRCTSCFFEPVQVRPPPQQPADVNAPLLFQMQQFRGT